MDPEQPSNKKEQMVGRVILSVGLVLVAGALAVYHYSPQMHPAAPAANGTDADATPAPAPAAPPDIRGKAAPDFELPGLNGKMVRRSDLQGKVLLVNFWATWCEPCQVEIPWFVKFQQQYGPQGFQVVAIDVDEGDKKTIGPKVVEPFVKQHDMGGFAILLGDVDKTPEAFGGLLGLPTSFLIDRDGKFFSKHQGLVSRQDVQDEIEQLLRTPGTAPNQVSSGPGAQPAPNQAGAATPAPKS